MGYIHNSNKSRITIRVMLSTILIYLTNPSFAAFEGYSRSVICRVLGLEAIRYLPPAR